MQEQITTLQGRVPLLVNKNPYISLSATSYWSDGSGQSSAGISFSSGMPANIADKRSAYQTSYSISTTEPITFLIPCKFYVLSNAKQDYVGLGTSTAQTMSSSYTLNDTSNTVNWNNTRFGTETIIDIAAGDQLRMRSPNAPSGSSLRNVYSMTWYLIS